MNLTLKRRGSQLCLEQYVLLSNSKPGALLTSKLFMVQVNQKQFSASDLTFESATLDESTAGVTHFQAHLGSPGFEVVLHLKVFAETALVEMWPVIPNTGPEVCQVARVDSFSIDLPAASYKLFSFNSDWGQEFQPKRQPLAGKMILETRLGLSSRECIPGLLCSREQIASFRGQLPGPAIG